MDSRIMIRGIAIKNFRSIRRANIIVRDFNVFVGTNDAGKSNILKALNLFFNDQVDCGIPYNYQSDFTYLYPPKSKEAKAISIAIQFEIPSSFADGGIYVWEKVWKQTGKVSDTIKNEKGEEPSGRSRIPAALRRIKYRYVPAVKSPDYYKLLLGDLYASVAASLDPTLTDAVNSFSATLGSCTESITMEVFNRLFLSSKLTIPNDLNEIFKALIFRTSREQSEAGLSVPLTARGDGIQARHIPIILRYIAKEDQKSRNQGSTKVTTIWGFEEPENGLELAKTFDLANEFIEYSHELQIFVTTHSPAFYMKKEEDGANIFFVEKKASGSEETVVVTGKSSSKIADDMGLMPLVAPFIAEQAKKLELAQSIYSNNILTDIPTIMVEGETDVDYLKMAIRHFSAPLKQLIDEDRLRIIYKNDGAGTTQLCDWALAWIYSGFRSKMLILLDNDVAGRKAREEIIHGEAYSSRHNAIPMRVMLIEPSDVIIALKNKHIDLFFEIEHLCSMQMWEEWKEQELVSLRSDNDMRAMFEGLIPRDKSFDDIIDELVEEPIIRDTIVSFEPKKLKKKKMANFLRENHENEAEVFIGFKRTIEAMERFFVK